MREESYRGFPISKEEEKLIEEWKRKHESEAHNVNTEHDRMLFGGCCGGTYTYQFTPTTIGVFGSVICSCGARFNFQND